jgi:hypothetical protein
MMIQLIFYVPLTHAEKVKEAVFRAGAGQLGNYDCCSWETRGVGQFRALAGATPYIGEVGEVEKVEELKVELFCQESVLLEVIQALKVTHPYETPAFFAFKALNLNN